jgi:hypothetical protein
METDGTASSDPHDCRVPGIARERQLRRAGVIITWNNGQPSRVAQGGSGPSCGLGGA